jgi:hypothetical protein
MAIEKGNVAMPVDELVAQGIPEHAATQLAEMPDARPLSFREADEIVRDAFRLPLVPHGVDVNDADYMGMLNRSPDPVTGEDWTSDIEVDARPWSYWESVKAMLIDMPLTHVARNMTENVLAPSIMPSVGRSDTFLARDPASGELRPKPFTPDAWMLENQDVVPRWAVGAWMRGEFDGYETEVDLLSRIGRLEEQREAIWHEAQTPLIVSLPTAIGVGLIADPLMYATGYVGAKAVQKLGWRSIAKLARNEVQILEDLKVPTSVIDDLLEQSVNVRKAGGSVFTTPGTLEFELRNLQRQGRIVAMKVPGAADEFRYFEPPKLPRRLRFHATAVTAEAVVANSLWEMGHEITYDGVDYMQSPMDRFAFSTALGLALGSITHGFGMRMRRAEPLRAKAEVHRRYVQNKASAEQPMRTGEPALIAPPEDVATATDAANANVVVHETPTAKDVGYSDPGIKPPHLSEAIDPDVITPPPPETEPGPKHGDFPLMHGSIVELIAENGDAFRVSVLGYTKDLKRALVQFDDGSELLMPVDELTRGRDVTPLRGLHEHLETLRMRSVLNAEELDPASLQDVRNVAQPPLPRFRPSPTMVKYMDTLADWRLAVDARQKGEPVPPRPKRPDPFEDFHIVVGRSQVGRVAAQPFLWMSSLTNFRDRAFHSSSGPVKSLAHWVFHPSRLTSVGIQSGRHPVGARVPLEIVRRSYMDEYVQRREMMDDAIMRLMRSDPETGEPTRLGKFLATHPTVDDILPTAPRPYVVRRFEMAHDLILAFADDPFTTTTAEVYASLGKVEQKVFDSLADDLKIEPDKLFEHIDYARRLHHAPVNEMEAARREAMDSLFRIKFRSGVTIDDLTEVLGVVFDVPADERSWKRVLFQFYDPKGDIRATTAERIQYDPKTAAEEIASWINYNVYANVSAKTVRELFRSGVQWKQQPNGQMIYRPTFNLDRTSFDGANRRAAKGMILLELVRLLRDYEIQMRAIGAEYPYVQTTRHAEPFYEPGGISFWRQPGEDAQAEMRERLDHWIDYQNKYLQDPDLQLSQARRDRGRKHATSMIRMIEQLAFLHDDQVSSNMAFVTHQARNLTTFTKLVGSGLSLPPEFLAASTLIATSPISQTLLDALKTSLSASDDVGGITTLKRAVREDPNAAKLLRLMTHLTERMMGSIVQRTGESGYGEWRMTTEEWQATTSNITGALAKLTATASGLESMTNLIKAMATLAVTAEFQLNARGIADLIREFDGDLTSPEARQAIIERLNVDPERVHFARSFLKDSDWERIAEQVESGDLETLGAWTFIPTRRTRPRPEPPQRPAPPPQPPTDTPPEATSPAFENKVAQHAQQLTRDNNGFTGREIAEDLNLDTAGVDAVLDRMLNTNRVIALGTQNGAMRYAVPELYKAPEAPPQPTVKEIALTIVGNGQLPPTIAHYYATVRGMTELAAELRPHAEKHPDYLRQKGYTPADMRHMREIFDDLVAPITKVEPTPDVPDIPASSIYKVAERDGLRFDLERAGFTLRAMRQDGSVVSPKDVKPNENIRPVWVTKDGTVYTQAEALEWRKALDAAADMLEQIGFAPSDVKGLKRAAMQVASGSRNDAALLLDLVGVITSNNPHLLKRLSVRHMKPGTTFKGRQANGHIDITNAADIVLRFAETGDVGTFIHEFGHLAHLLMGDNDWEAVIQYAAETDPAYVTHGDEAQMQLTRDGAEWVALQFEEMVRTRQPSNANSRIRAIFARLRDWLAQIYRTIRSYPSVKIHEKVGEIFDRILGGEYFRSVNDAEIARRLRRSKAWLRDLDVPPTHQAMGVPENAVIVAKEKEIGGTVVRSYGIMRKSGDGVPRVYGAADDPLIPNGRADFDAQWQALTPKELHNLLRWAETNRDTSNKRTAIAVTEMIDGLDHEAMNKIDAQAERGEVAPDLPAPENYEHWHSTPRSSAIRPVEFEHITDGMLIWDRNDHSFEPWRVEALADAPAGLESPGEVTVQSIYSGTVRQISGYELVSPDNPWYTPIGLRVVEPNRTETRYGVKPEELSVGSVLRKRNGVVGLVAEVLEDDGDIVAVRLNTPGGADMGPLGPASLRDWRQLTAETIDSEPGVDTEVTQPGAVVAVRDPRSNMWINGETGGPLVSGQPVTLTGYRGVGRVNRWRMYYDLDDERGIKNGLDEGFIGTEPTVWPNLRDVLTRQSYFYRSRNETDIVQSKISKAWIIEEDGTRTELTGNVDYRKAHEFELIDTWSVGGSPMPHIHAGGTVQSCGAGAKRHRPEGDNQQGLRRTAGGSHRKGGG